MPPVYKKKGTLASRFIFIVLMFMMIGQGILWLWFLYYQKQNALKTQQEKISLVSKFVADSAMHAMDSGVYKELDKSILAVMADKDIISIRVLDGEGKVVTHISSTVENRKDSINPLFVSRKRLHKTVVESEGKPIGGVEVTVSGQRINDGMQELLIVPPALQMLVFVGVAYGIYFFFQLRIGRPISALRQSMERVTAGDLTVKVPEMHDHELGVIAEGMEYLVVRFSTAIKRLNSTSDHVVETIKGLNDTFAASIDLIKKQTSLTEEIVQSLKRANESQREISESSDTLSKFSSDNVSSLLEVRATADEIVNGMNSLLKATEDSYAVVGEIAQTLKVMNGRAQEVLASVENTSASVEEIMASVREVESNAKESSLLAQSVREEAAQRGVNTVAEAVRGMEQISEKVKYSAEILRRLGERSRDVQRILSVIREITEQTNLLSINAAILAEQAGEHGKGFTVVAGEMRALSDRTNDYTKEISSIIMTTLSEIKEAAGSIEENLSMVAQGYEVVYKVGESMSAILEAAHKSALMTKMIERATEDQSKALRHIESAVIDINTMTLDMTNAIEEQHKGSDHLLRRTGEFRETMQNVKTVTEEQAVGTKNISTNLELEKDRVENINAAVFNQQKVYQGIIMSVESIRDAGNRTVKEAEWMSHSLVRLQEEIEMLRKEMESFRTD